MLSTAIFVKLIPYVIGMRVVGGMIDISVHAIKCRISKI